MHYLLSKINEEFPKLIYSPNPYEVLCKPQTEEEHTMLSRLREVCMYGWKLSYFPEVREFRMTDIHLAKGKMISFYNKPKFTLTFNENIEKVNFDGTLYVKKDTPISVSGDGDSLIDTSFINCYINGEKIECEPQHIFWDEDSIDTWYSFDGITAVTLTPSKLRRYWASYDYDIVKHSLNVYSAEYDFGYFFGVATTLFEVANGTTYLGENTTEKDIDALAVGHENSWVIKSLRRDLKARNNSDEDDKQEKREKISDLLSKYQDLANTYSDEVISYVADSLIAKGLASPNESPSNVIKEFTKKNDSYYSGIFFDFKDEELQSLLKEVGEYGLSNVFMDGSFKITLPYPTCNTTVVAMEGTKLRELAQVNGLPEINFSLQNA